MGASTEMPGRGRALHATVLMVIGMILDRDVHKQDGANDYASESKSSMDTVSHG